MGDDRLGPLRPSIDKQIRELREAEAEAKRTQPSELERIAAALERSAAALEQIGTALRALVPPDPELPDTISGDEPGGMDVEPSDYRRFGRPGDLPRSPDVAPPDDSRSDRP